MVVHGRSRWAMGVAVVTGCDKAILSVCGLSCGRLDGLGGLVCAECTMRGHDALGIWALRRGYDWTWRGYEG